MHTDVANLAGMYVYIHTGRYVPVVHAMVEN